ncbi:inclusion body family protein [Streptosporangium canum]|uniref:inclusion body family protein n=1 Tax=Streptosporangium canum TaxID=324952 RepID=UPI003675BA88
MRTLLKDLDSQILTMVDWLGKLSSAGDLQSSRDCRILDYGLSFRTSRENFCMSEFINVLIAIDAETILGKYGKNTDPNSPASIPDSSSLIYMTTRQNQLGSTPGSELTINASPMDIIRWRETTLSLNSEYTSVLYRFNALSGQGLISTPVPRSVVLNEPQPSSQDPLNPTTQKINSYYWESEVLDTGTVTYNFSFMILNHKGEKQGYYYWDPYINIQD